MLYVVAYAETDEVGLDVVVGESKRGKEVLGEIVTSCNLLVEQHAEGR